MPTPDISKTLTVKPKYEKGKVTSFNLKPIRRRIEQVIGKFDVRHTNIGITVTTKQTDAITFDTRIIVQGPPRPPEETPAHPPKKVFIYQ